VPPAPTSTLIVAADTKAGTTAKSPSILVSLEIMTGGNRWSRRNERAMSMSALNNQTTTPILQCQGSTEIPEDYTGLTLCEAMHSLMIHRVQDAFHGLSTKNASLLD